MREMNLARKTIFVTCACALFSGSLCSATTSTITDGSVTWRYTVLTGSSEKIALSPDSYGKPCIDASTSGTLTIPSTLTKNSVTYTVTRLASNSFTNCTKITKVVLPSTVTQVYGAFIRCLALTNVTLQSSKITFNERSFVNCPQFTTFELKGDAANSYAVEEGVLYTAGKTKLVRCPTGIESVIIPSSVSEIGGYAFSHTLVRSVVLPENLQTIVPFAFYRADSLESFAIPEANELFATRDGVLYTKDLKTLVRCPGGRTAFEIPTGVTNIADYAFYGCAKLTAVTCPESLLHLSMYAFADTPALNVVRFKGDLPELGSDQHLGDIAFSVRIIYPEKYAANWTASPVIMKYDLRDSFSPKGTIISFY